MRVLAADTTSGRGSLAVVTEEGVLGETRVFSPAGHSRWLLPAVDALLRGLGLEPAEIEAFAVTTGPGSFTGLRVGLSSVQGLAIAAGRPCVALSALDTLAWAVAGTAESTVAIMDAFRGEVYWAAYEGDGSPRGDAQLGRLDEVLDGVPPGAAFVGDAVAAGRSLIEERVVNAVFPASDLYLAVPLGRAALVRLSAGQTIAAAALRPLYLRGADTRPPRS